MKPVDATMTLRRAALAFMAWASLAAACVGDVDAARNDASADSATTPDGGRDAAQIGPGAGGSDGGSGDAGSGDAGTHDAGAPGGDASTSDAGAPGVGVDAGAQAGCASARYALCEDFESAADGALPSGWSVLMGWGGGTAPAVVSSQHHGGSRALAAGVATNGQSRIAHALAALGPTASKHWGRVFYRAEPPIALPGQGAVLHNTLVALRGTDESRVVDTVISSDGSHQFLYNVPDDSVGIGTAYDYRSYDGAWHCAEWYVDASTQTYRFFYEGKETPFVQGSGQTPKLEPFDALVVGFINYQSPARPLVGYFDDLALHDQRIGCD